MKAYIPLNAQSDAECKYYCKEIEVVELGEKLYKAVAVDCGAVKNIYYEPVTHRTEEGLDWNEVARLSHEYRNKAEKLEKENANLKRISDEWDAVTTPLFDYVEKQSDTKLGGSKVAYILDKVVRLEKENAELHTQLDEKNRVLSSALHDVAQLKKGQVVWEESAVSCRANGVYLISNDLNKDSVLSVHWNHHFCIIPQPTEDEAEEAWEKSSVRESVRLLGSEIFQKVKADWIKDHRAAQKKG